MRSLWWTRAWLRRIAETRRSFFSWRSQRHPTLSFERPAQLRQQRLYCNKASDEEVVTPLKNAIYMGIATAFGVTVGNLIPPMFMPPKEIVFEMDKNRSGVDPCAREMESFHNCAKTVSDMKDCSALYEALKGCRKQEGVPPKPPRN